MSNNYNNNVINNRKAKMDKMLNNYNIVDKKMKKEELQKQTATTRYKQRRVEGCVNKSENNIKGGMYSVFIYFGHIIMEGSRNIIGDQYPSTSTIYIHSKLQYYFPKDSVNSHHVLCLRQITLPATFDKSTQTSIYSLLFFFF